MSKSQKNTLMHVPTPTPVRTEATSTRRVGDEAVVYDAGTTTTHALGPVGAAVFAAVDGHREPAVVGAVASASFGESLTEQQVERALFDLTAAGLIRYSDGGVGRRRVLTAGAAVGAMAVPTVISVIAPSPAAAQSDDGGGTTGGGGTDGGVATTTTLPPQPVGDVSTLAGNAQGFADGTGANAQFNFPPGIAVGSDGTIYVADEGNQRIRAITPAGAVTTLAGSTQGFVDGTGVNAQFNNPARVAVGPDGTVYVADTGNHRIRAITPAGAVTTLAGSTQGFADGTGANAQFSNPIGVAVATDGTVYVADQGNHRIRAITPAGAVTTLAGSTRGFAEGTGANAQFNSPSGIAAAPDGTLYVVDVINNRIRAITPAGAVTTLAGSTAGNADGTGANAQFRNPRGVAVAPDGTVYVADFSNYLVRSITPTGIVTTLAGSTRGFAEGTGANAQFNNLFDVAVAPDGTVYVADSGNHRIRAIL